MHLRGSPYSDLRRRLGVVSARGRNGIQIRAVNVTRRATVDQDAVPSAAQGIDLHGIAWIEHAYDRGVAAAAASHVDPGPGEAFGEGTGRGRRAAPKRVTVGGGTFQCGIGCGIGRHRAGRCGERRARLAGRSSLSGSRGFRPQSWHDHHEQGGPQNQDAAHGEHRPQPVARRGPLERLCRKGHAAVRAPGRDAQRLPPALRALHVGRCDGVQDGPHSAGPPALNPQHRLAVVPTAASVRRTFRSRAARIGYAASRCCPSRSGPLG